MTAAPSIRFDLPPPPPPPPPPLPLQQQMWPQLQHPMSRFPPKRIAIDTPNAQPHRAFLTIRPSVRGVPVLL
jgi:hypothetical protein